MKTFIDDLESILSCNVQETNKYATQGQPYSEMYDMKQSVPIPPWKIRYHTLLTKREEIFMPVYDKPS